MATGLLTLTDTASGTVWNAERLGVVQTAKGWASVTAVLKDKAGNRRGATFTVDESDTSAGAAQPKIVVSFDGQPDLVGAPTGKTLIAAR